MKNYTPQETANFKAERRAATAKFKTQRRTGYRFEPKYPDNATAAQRGWTDIGGIAKRIGKNLVEPSVKKTIKNIEDLKARIKQAAWANGGRMFKGSQW